MDRKICDVCGKEIQGYFTKIAVHKMVHDGKDTWYGAESSTKCLLKEYEMCDKCSPIVIVTRAFRDCSLFKTIKEVGL